MNESVFKKENQEYKDLPGSDNSTKDKKVFRVGVSPVRPNPKIGGLRSHLYNYAFAKSEALKGLDSKIIFRVDDTNNEKHLPENVKELYNFFSEGLGLSFDVTPDNSFSKIGASVFQSERQDVYKRYLEELFDKHVAFLDKDSGLVLFDIESFIKHYDNIIEINDLLRGKIKFSLEEKLKSNNKYFPILRSDASTLYHLANVVDDSDFEVTHVVRGVDKLPILEFQEMVRIVLDFDPKIYLHTPLLLSEEGGRLGGKVSFNDFLKQGFTSHSLISYMISSGYGNPDEIYPSIDSFIDTFDYRKIHKNNGIFDLKKLNNINREIAKKTEDKLYIESIFIYLSKINEVVKLEALQKSSLLQKILLTLRRPPLISLDILECILTPKHEPVRKDLEYCIKEVLKELKNSEFVLMPDPGKLSFSKQEFYSALNWILVGRYSYPSIDLNFDYFKSKNIIKERVQNALDILASN